MLSAEINSVLDESARKLNQVSNPPVRYWLLSEVLNKGPEDMVLQRALEECMDFPPKIRLLESIKEDGTWTILKKQREREVLGPPMNWTLTTMLRNLFFLLQYKADRNEGRISVVTEKILGWQADDGYIYGPWTMNFPLPYWNGFVAHDLIRLGMSEDRRVMKLVKWLLSEQRKDGGWNIPYMQDVKYLPQFRKMGIEIFIEVMGTAEMRKYDRRTMQDVPSCTWSTLNVLWGLVEDPELRRSAAVKRGANLLLDRFFKRNPHPSFNMSESNWYKFRYPPHYGGGLPVLDVLTRVGIGLDDPRMEKPIEWLVGARGNDGLWHRTKGPSAEIDQWLTLSALQVLSRYLRSG